MTDETMPTNVIAALARVTAEMGGIQKTRGGEGGISYAYRGIDAIAASAQPLLGKYGVVIVPETQIQRIEELSVNGKPWTDTFITVTWTIYGPGGVDDRISAVTQGVGRDNSDKGFNKSATQAFKNLLLRVLCIGDPNDDADTPQHQNNYTDAAPTSADLAARTFEAVKALGSERAKAFVAFIGDQITDAPKVSFAAMEADHAWQGTVARMLTQWTTENPVPVPDMDVMVNEVEQSSTEADSPVVALEPTLRQRVDALPQPMKKQLNVDCTAEGIKNMLMPKKSDEPFIARWLDKYDAEVLEAAELEMTLGAGNDVGGSIDG